MSGSDSALESLCAELERLSQADPPRAVAVFEDSAEALARAGNEGHFARATRAVINALAHQGRVVDAVRLAARARRHARTEAPVESARVLIAAMHPRAKRGDLAGARRAGLRGLAELERLSHPGAVARARISLANVAKAMGRAPEAIAHLRQALADDTGVAPVKGAALNALGEALVLAGEFSQAQASFEQAMEVFASQGSPLLVAIAQGNLADVAARRGDIEAALRNFSKAGDAFEAAGAFAEAARSTLEEAELLEQSGLTADAADRATEAGTLAREHGLGIESARAGLVLGRLFAATGRPDRALAMLEPACDVARASGDTVTLVQALVAASGALVRMGRVAQATAAADEALARAATPAERALALLGKAASSSDERASPLAQDAAQRAGDLGIRSLRAQAHLLCARVARRTGRIPSAISEAEAAVDDIDRARDTISHARLRRAFIAGRMDAYEALAGALLDDGSPEAAARALAVLEHARLAALVGVLRADTLAAGAASAPTPRSHALRQRARDLRDRLGVDASEGERIELASRAERAAARRELAESIGAGEPGAQAVAGELAPPPPCAVPSVTVFEDGGRVWLLSRGADGCVRASACRASRDTIAEACAQWRFEVGRRLRGAPGRAAEARMRESAMHALSSIRESIIDEMAAAIPAGRAVIVPSPCLETLPMLALAPDGCQWALAPSLGAAAVMDGNAGRDANGAVVVSFGAGSAQGIEREGALVPPLLVGRGVSPVAVIRGADATRSRVIEALGGAGLAHVACHGVFPAGDPAGAGLRLQDGWLTVGDVHSIVDGPRDVILSGCMSGVSSNHSGELWCGFLRGFAQAGAARILASHWAVEDEAALATMAQVHASPSLGIGALSAAHRALEGRIHPALACPFVVVGGARAFD